MTFDQLAYLHILEKLSGVITPLLRLLPTFGKLSQHWSNSEEPRGYKHSDSYSRKKLAHCAHLVSSEGVFDAKDPRCCWIKSEAFFRYPCPSTTLDAWRLRRAVNRLLGGYLGFTGGGALRSFFGLRISVSRGSLSSPASESSKWRFFESQLRLIVVDGRL